VIGKSRVLVRFPSTLLRPSVSHARKAVSALTIQFSNGKEFYSGRASRGCREFLVLSSIPLVLCDFKLFLLFAFFSHVRAFFLTERNVPFLSLARSPFLFRKRENRLFLTKEGLDLRIIQRLKIETVLYGKNRFGRTRTRGYLRKKGGIAFYILSSVVFVIASFPWDVERTRRNSRVSLLTSVQDHWG